MPFYFAWVGGDPIPAFTLATTGNVWGGSITVLGSVWGGELNTTGDLLPGAVWNDRVQMVSNLSNVDGLRTGIAYTITGIKSTPKQVPLEPTTGFGLNSIAIENNVAANDYIKKSNAGRTISTGFSFDGQYGGYLDGPVDPGENIGFSIRSGVYSDPDTGVLTPVPGDTTTQKIVLKDVSQLVVGRTYGITGSGLDPNTTFTFTGDAVITISSPALKTGANVPLKITGDEFDQIRITNLSDATGLMVGETYEVFGKGLPSSVLGIYQADGTILLTQPATISTVQTFIRIHRGIVYPDGGTFDPVVHARHDEIPVSIDIEHSEGNAALMSIELRNPRIGLLAPGRNLWCWFSWRDPETDIIYPVFHGRLIAIPKNLQAEKVTFQFIAKPSDYENQQALVMTTLHDDSYDPVWYTNGIVDSTSILEARTEDWHTDRTNLEVSLSDVTIGEDGTLDIAASEHVYADMGITFGTAPLAGVYLSASVQFEQEGFGEIDINEKVKAAFGGVVQTYCGNGLKDGWPKPFTSIGGGWTVGSDSTIVESSLNPITLSFLTSWSQSWSIGDDDTGKEASGSYQQTVASFPLNVYETSLNVRYDASRKWTETVSFFMESDTQQIMTDSRASVKTFSLSSSLVNFPVDDDGSMPFADPRGNTYFKTVRGQKSVRWLIRYGRAKLIESARAVEVSCTVQWQKAVIAGISCRWNCHLTDARLPGGEAIGKITSYKLIASAKDGMKAHVKFGCTIGRGGSVVASPGIESYAAPGYMASGYQAMKGGTIDIGDGSITYQNFGDFSVIDDGVNLFDMSPDTAIKRLLVTVGLDEQITAMTQTKVQDAAHYNLAAGFSGLGSQITPPPKPDQALKNAYARVILEMYPVTGGDFLTEFVVDVSKLQIPKTINLEAPSSP